MPSDEPAEHPRPDAAVRAAEAFERLARTAEDLADTALASATVHEALDSPEATEHADRERLFAEAERDAAAAYRSGQVPSAQTRQTIRDVRHPAT